MSNPERRTIKRLLVANRGEIATRILATSRELDIETYAVYTSGDASHTRGADHAVELPGPASYMSIDDLLAVAKKHQIDAIHPGYGFLSESETFASRLWDEAGVVVIGPGSEILSRTGDKLKARALAEECHVPVCPGILNPTDNVQSIKEFASKNGYPVMIKAVDGGGGRGIRLVRKEAELGSNVKRAIEESPSKKVFVERAAIDGFRHIEVQIIGDGSGNIRHLWERECSLQRRYQKIVEIAPSSFKDRTLPEKIIDSAVRMAKHVKYVSLGTFEFLANPSTAEYFFLEINPRLQVEHTITECISLTDLVRVQLLVAQGASLKDVYLPDYLPPLHSIQLRVTAENVQSNWSLSIGKINSFQFPSGNGIRVDTHLVNGYQSVVSADFDSLVAKVIVSGSTWEATVRKARRALDETQINGVHTNLDILRAIMARPEFLDGMCDTQWLESNQVHLLEDGKKISKSTVANNTHLRPSNSSSNAAASSVSNLLFRKGDAWSLSLTPQGQKADAEQAPHHLEITRVLRNEFPNALAAEVTFTIPASGSSSQAKQLQYAMDLSSTTASSSAATSTHRRGNPGDPSHIVIPFPGKLVEVLVDKGDEIHEGDVICVVQQMKMELEVRANRSGKVMWILEAEEGEDIGENTLACIVEREKGARL